MKVDKKALFTMLTRISGIFLAFGIIAIIYSVKQDDTFLLALGIPLALIGLVGAPTFFILNRRPDNGLKTRWLEYIQIAASRPDENGEPSDIEIDYAAQLEKIRKNYGADGDIKKNRIGTPEFHINRSFLDKTVLQSGNIYYGHLVEANDRIFKESSNINEILPAVYIYGTDEYYNAHPEELKQLSESLFADRRNNFLANERAYFSNKKLPLSMTDGRTVYATTIPVCRKHLPFGRIGIYPILPVIADPEKSDAVFTVDCKYWTDDLIYKYMNYKIALDNSYGEPFDI